jgi:hypothetical protein
MYKSRTTSKVAFLIGIFIFLSGCAGSAYHHYSGDHLPETKLAAIKPWFKGTLDVFPASIDGKATDIYLRIALPSHYVLPGEHKIKIALSTDQFRIVDPKIMAFKAEANHIYITKAAITKLQQSSGEMKVKASFWIEDINSKQVVAGTRPSTTTNSSHEIDVPGTAANVQLQNDITQKLIEEASKNHGDCGHIVLKADAYKATEPSVIVIEMGGDAPALAKSLRAKDLILVEKWFLKSCETVNIYEVLLWKSGTGTDIMVKRLDTGE